MLAKNPGFTIVAVLTLALGSGANTAIFSVVYGVILRPLPYPQPERIMEIARKFPNGYGERTTFKKFQFWREHNQTFEYMAAYKGVGYNLAGGVAPERVRGMHVSADYLHVLGVAPLLGRDFLPEEDRADGRRVAILANGLWKRGFGADPGVIGQKILLDGDSYTVIGVMPQGFQTDPPNDLWTPLALEEKALLSGYNQTVIGRLKSGISPKQAQADMVLVAERFRRELGMSPRESVLLFRYRQFLARNVQSNLLILFGAVSFVLLIACANVASLQLARAASRGKEIAIRTSLGATRVRLIRQLLTESAILSLLGGMLGVILARASLDALLALTPADLPRASNILIDRWALGFTVLVAAATGVLSGLAPALQVSRTNPNETLREPAGRGIGGGRRAERVRRALAVAEIALALVLLAGAALMIRTHSNLLATDPGFNPKHILTAEVWIIGSQYNSTAAIMNLYENLLTRIQSLPGIEAAGVVAAGLPLDHAGNVYMLPEGRDPTDGVSADYREITPDYFRVMGTPLRMGRAFTKADTENAQQVAIVNEAFAKAYFEKTAVLGRLITFDAGGPSARLREIMGVVADVKSSLDQPAEPTAFIPAAQAAFEDTHLFSTIFPTNLVVRAAGDPLSLHQTVEQEVHNADPTLPIGRIRSMVQVRSGSLAVQQFNMLLLGIFASVALLLAAVGVYGLMAYSVSQRSHEIGVRMALGARPADVLQQIAGQGLQLALIGVALGLIGAMTLTRIMSSLLYGVKATDPLTLTAASGVLVGVALAACMIPARRAMRVDPTTALRHE